MRFRLLANRDVLAYALGYGVVGVALALRRYGVWALVVAQLTQAVLRTAIRLHSGPPILRARPTWQSSLELMDYGVGQSVGRLGVIDLTKQITGRGRWRAPPHLARTTGHSSRCPFPRRCSGMCSTGCSFRRWPWFSTIHAASDRPFGRGPRRLPCCPPGRRRHRGAGSGTRGGRLRQPVGGRWSRLSRYCRGARSGRAIA